MTINRDDLRALARDLNDQKIAELIGHKIDATVNKSDLEADLEDAVREIVIAGALASFNSFKRSGAHDAFAKLLERCSMPAPKPENCPPEFEPATEEDFKDEPNLPETDMDGCRFHEPDEPENVTIEQVAADIKSAANKHKTKKAPSEKKRSTNSKWAWLAERLQGKSKIPATRANLMNEMAEAFPDASKSTIQTLLSDCLNPKYSKLDFTIKVNEDKVFVIA